MPGFTYKSYSFVDKDPIIDNIRTVINNSGATYKYISENSGVNKNTLRGWLDGKTKRPQAASINAVLRVLGYKLDIVRFGKAVKIVTETQPKPAKDLAMSSEDIRHVVHLSKYTKVRRRKS